MLVRTPSKNAHIATYLRCNVLEVKPNAAESFGEDGTVAIGLNTVWFELWERVWYTTSPEHPNIALNVSFLNGGQRTREATAAVDIVDRTRKSTANKAAATRTRTQQTPTTA
jgi:hypothetical protein